MDKGRFEAFSDGVIAVAITLLALDLVVGGPGHGNGTLAHQLADRWPAFAAYALVFEGMSLGFFSIFWWSIRRELLVVPMTKESARGAIIRFGVLGNAAYVVAIAVAFVSAPASLVITALVAVYYVFEQTPDASPAQR